MWLPIAWSMLATVACGRVGYESRARDASLGERSEDRAGDAMLDGRASADAKSDEVVGLEGGPPADAPARADGPALDGGLLDAPLADARALDGDDDSGSQDVGAPLEDAAAPPDTRPDAGSADGPNIVFITSTAISSLAGVAAGDAACAERALAAGLAGPFVAWMSTTTEPARDRLVGSAGWVRTDGRPVANSLSDLLAGRTYYPPNLDETGRRVTARVISGTAADGTPGLNCTDYTDMAGFITTTSPSASPWSSTGADFCTISAPVLCFGVGRVRDVTPTITGRRAFVSTGEILGSSRVMGADALCAREASDAGLPGTYLALLGTIQEGPIERFNLDGAPWVRLDGVELAATARAFAAYDHLAPLDVTADGTRVAPRAVWTGAVAPDLLTPPTNSVCQNWTMSGFSIYGRYGRVGMVGQGGFVGGTLACANGAVVYCLEE